MGGGFVGCWVGRFTSVHLSAGVTDVEFLSLSTPFIVFQKFCAGFGVYMYVHVATKFRQVITVIELCSVLAD